MAKMKIEYNETLTEKMKVAIVYGMLPKELQEKALGKRSVASEAELDRAISEGAWMEAWFHPIAEGHLHITPPTFRKVLERAAARRGDHSPFSSRFSALCDRGNMSACRCGRSVVIVRARNLRESALAVRHPPALGRTS